MDCAPHAPKGGKVDKAHTQTNDDIAWNLLWVIFFKYYILHRLLDSIFFLISTNSLEILKISQWQFSLSLSLCDFLFEFEQNQKKNYVGDTIYIYIRKEMLSITRVLCSCACLLHQQRETNEGAWRQPLQNQNNQIKLQN